MNTPKFTFPQIPENLQALASDTMTLLRGGVEWQVLNRKGEVETVLIRQIPVRQLQKFEQSLFDEAALVELVCEQKEGWDDTLVIASHEQLVAIGRAINTPFFNKLQERLLRDLEVVKENADRLEKAGVPIQPATPTRANDSPSTASSAPSAPPASSIIGTP